MDTAELKRRWRDKNAQRGRAVPVEIDSVGTIYVRVLKVTDQDALSALANSTDQDAKAVIMAGLLCDENGDRLAAAEVAEFTEIFKSADWSDYIKVTTAGAGIKAGDDAGN
jgi:hypothetical protein